MITRVAGIRVGHWTDPVGLTGCTVVLPPPATIASGAVRGGAPGTRETDLLRPGMMVEEANAVLLTGGSAFGLAAADGVMAFLEEIGVGFDTGAARVPIVPAAVLFDLGVGDPAARPGSAAGRDACEAATDGDVAEGSVGAGTGATVAKLFGLEYGLKGGVGSAATEDGEVVVGALAAVNALGEIVDDAGAVIAGSRSPHRSEGSPEGGSGGGWPAEANPPAPGQPGNTTLVVVATNAKLSRERAHLLAQAAHEGISAAVRPAHTIWDGDTVFTLATARVEADQRTVEALAVTATSEAIRRAVLAADGAPGFPSAREVRS
jgi:L-aminopeptidase/D-esterase-like protein